MHLGCRFSLLALSFLSSCCISMPKWQQQEELLPSPSLECSLERGAESPFFAVGPWPDENWWEIFSSDQLNSLISIALANNPSIQEVYSRVLKARAKAVYARAPLFPLLFFDAQDSWSYLSKNGLYKTLNPNISSNASLIDLSLSVTYDFDFWCKNENLFLAALGKERSKEAERAQVELVVTTNLAQAYFALQTNLYREKLIQNLVTERSKLFQLQNVLRKEAINSLFPQLLSEERFYEAEEQLAAIHAEVLSNYHTINVLLGQSPDAPLCLCEELPPLPERLIIPETISLDLVARRPDLLAQIWRVEALGHEVGAAIADFFPDVNIKAFVGLESVFYSRLFQAGSMTGGATPALHLPIFTAGAISANVWIKRTKFDAAVFAYNELLLRSAQEVADLIAFGESVFRQKQEQEKVVQSAQERYRLTYLRLSKGLDSRLQSYVIYDDWLQKELTNVTLLYNQYAAAIKLIKALGGGYCAEVPLEGSYE